MGMMDEIPRLSPEMASRKTQVADFIRSFYSHWRRGPSMGEIAAALNISTSRAKALVRRLDQDGTIDRLPGVAHSIRPREACEEAIALLRARGYVVNEDVFAAPILPLLDLDQ